MSSEPYYDRTTHRQPPPPRQSVTCQKVALKRRLHRLERAAGANYAMVADLAIVARDLTHVERDIHVPRPENEILAALQRIRERLNYWDGGAA
jgi:hypothetical protein